MITIRPVTANDATEVARLASELGYSATPTEIAERIAHQTKVPGRAVFVACDGEQIAGYIDLSTEMHLHATPKARIDGLVVSESARGKGVGALLCRHAEEWARQQGLKTMMLTSRSTRERAHAFYERDGYRRTKTSYLFEKDL